ncbi:MAG: GtrA family protein [Sphingomonadaceae bacterium]|nr:GtrA family protein [Sphingomonadaceae bacterium]
MIRQLGPYGVIAAICALLNIAILVGGDRLGLHFAVSTTISFVVCVVAGFLLHCRYTFRAAASWAGLMRYTLAMALNYPLSLLAVWLFYDVLALSMILAAPASTVALTAYNFLSSRWALARNPQSQ